jgi:hypothetical protein
MTPVGLRPPTAPNGRRTLPPFGAIRSGGPLPGVVETRPVALAVPEESHHAASYDEVLHEAAIAAAMEPDAESDETSDAESDGWYDDAESVTGVEPVAQAMAEPSRDAFDAAVRDLPLYVPENVDVSRLTPPFNAAIPAEPEPAAHSEPTPDAAAAEWAAFVGTTPVDETPTREWRSPQLTPTPIRSVTPVRAMTPVRDATPIEPAAAVDSDAVTTPHRMTPMRVTPIMAPPYRPTPVMGTRTPVRPQSPADGSEVIGVVPSAANRVVAAALEAVAAQVRRGALVVSGSVPEGDDSHSLAAALAAALGALLGVSR